MASDPTQLPFVKPTIDAVAAASVAGTIMGWLPIAVGVLTGLYFALQIYESRTFTSWNKTRKDRRRARKIARLKAKLAKAEGMTSPT